MLYFLIFVLRSFTFIQASIYVYTNFTNPEIADGSIDKPFTNLSIALIKSISLSDPQILLSPGDLYSDVVEDVLLSSPLQIKLASGGLSPFIKLNSGIIRVKNQVKFENIVFSRANISKNENAFIVEKDGLLTFLVYFFLN